MAKLRTLAIGKSNAWVVSYRDGWLQKINITTNYIKKNIFKFAFKYCFCYKRIWKSQGWSL